MPSLDSLLETEMIAALTKPIAVEAGLGHMGIHRSVIHPRFGSFILVPLERLLLREGKAVAMTGRAFDLLAELVSNAGHLLTKDQALDQLLLVGG